MCECKSGNYGKFCQKKYRCKNCNYNACIKNNTCLRCKSGWNGENCKNRIINRAKMCLNKGKIKIYKKKLECDCKSSFFGKYCEINCSDICPSNDCTMKDEFICKRLITRTKLTIILPIIVFTFLFLVIIIIIYKISSNQLLGV
ncbi:hypothetical protein HZS_1296 [Henneguya salminicola]|nr:hypothetical protein HZS_1296 [Henneguya salminicola]